LNVVLVLDSSAVTRLAERSRFAAALIQALRAEGLWPPTIPSVVLVECLEGHGGRDAAENAFLKTCDIVEEVSETSARRAAFLRRHARRGSAVDALVVAAAERGGTVLTSDPRDLEALASHAQRVRIERI
jgi:predicted nucleic acid-binding protein